MTSPANPSAFENWNGEQGLRWVASADQRDQILAPAADALLATAHPALGSRVLDIGCGCGVTTLLAASSIGPDGWVTGVDISAPMLEEARGRARARGVTNAEFVHADAQIHAFEAESVDLVMSRFGTMFFADPGAAFANIAAAVRPGGRLCLATWQPLVANEWLLVPATALLRHTDLPAAMAPTEPGMFAQSDPEVVTAVLDAAGFADVQLAATEVTFALGSTVDEAVDYLAETGPGRLLLAAIPEGSAREAALADVRESLVAYQSDAGVRLGGGIWIITATRQR